MSNNNNHSKFGEFITRYVDWVIRYKWLVVIATLVFVVFAASGLKNLRIDTNYRVFFSEDNPQLKAFEEMQNVYTKDDNKQFVNR